MAESPHLFEVTHADFATRVVEKSRDVPVLVDFWAAWCAPCRALLPVLARLVEEYAGRLLLAKVNTDVEQDLARRFAIRGIPAVKLFRGGEIVGEFVGVQPESVIRGLVERHLPSPADAAVERAEALAHAGETDAALALLREAITQNPLSDGAKLALARLLIEQSPENPGENVLDECRQLLETLSVRAGMSPEAEALRSRLALQRLAADAPPAPVLEQALAADPGNHAARLQLAARLALRGAHEAAMEHLLDLVRRNRRYGDDAGRRLLVDIFTLLGNQHPLVVKYRAALSRALN